MNKVIKIALMIGFVVIGTVLAIAFGTQEEVLPIGSPIPKFKYVSLNDSGFISIKDKPIMIMLFKPDCPHCEYEFEAMNKRCVELDEVNIYFITTDKKYIQDSVYCKWNNLINQKNIVFASVNELEFKEKIGINVTPAFLFFNNTGTLANKIIGETKFDRLLGLIRRTDGSKHQSGG